MDIKKYWDKVNALAPQLPGDTVWLMSLDNDTRNTKTGMVCEVNRKHAAERIVQGTSRLATPEEVAAHQAKRGEYTESARKRELARKPQTVLVVGEEQVQALTGGTVQTPVVAASIKATKEART